MTQPVSKPMYFAEYCNDWFGKCLTYYHKKTYDIPVKSHGFAVSLTVLAMTSRSHADYVISHSFQLLQNLRNKYYGFMNKSVKPLVCVLVVSDLMLAT